MSRFVCPECDSTHQARPRFQTKPTPRAPGWSRRIYSATEAITGHPPLPWQRPPMRLIAETGNGGTPRWPTVIVSVPRQSGKTTIAKAATTAKAELADDQRLFGTAQTRLDAVAHLEELALSLGDSAKSRLGVGAERITWPNGSIYRVIAPTDTGGHGPSLDWMLIDEAWTLARKFLGGVRPAMSAKPQSSMLITSTMGTVESEVWNDLVAMGREAIDDPDARIAYVEYSAPSDDAVFDESRWHEWMPALGHTVTHAHIRADMKLLEPADFIRGYGNRTTAAVVSIFPADWLEKAWRVIDPPQRFVVAIDVNNDPAGASVTTGHITTEGIAARLVEWRYGAPRWVPGFVADLVAARDVEAIVGDFGGPARAIHAELKALADAQLIPLVDRVPRDFAKDTLKFYDDLRDGHIQLHKTAALAESFAAARRKDFSDTGLWVVSRGRMTVDASPAISVILATGLAAELGVAPKPEFFIG